MNLISKLIKKGCFKNEDDRVDVVYILKQNWDYFYEDEYDDGEPDLDDNGFAYYVLYGKFEDFIKANRSHTCVSEEEAMLLAKKVLMSDIEWKNIVSIR